MKVIDVYNAVNEIAPFDNCCPWDNSGLILGSMDSDVSGIVVTLDADRYALDFAIKNGCNVVVSHHPVIWDALKQVTDKEMAYHYIRNGVTVICAHTCLDAATDGINDILADMMGMKDRKPFMCDGIGLGRYGFVTDEGLNSLISQLGTRGADCVISRPVHCAAVIGGAGGSELYDALALGCDTLVTGEAKHDKFVAAENLGVNLVVLGHYETEEIIVKPLTEKLSRKLNTKVISSDRKPLVTRR